MLLNVTLLSFSEEPAKNGMKMQVGDDDLSALYLWPHSFQTKEDPVQPHFIFGPCVLYVPSVSREHCEREKSVRIKLLRN